MPAFTGALNPNEIFSSIFNMIISQQVNASNVKEGFSSLVNNQDSRVRISAAYCTDLSSMS